MFINNLETKDCHDSFNHNETHIAKQLKYILIYKKKKKKIKLYPNNNNYQKSRILKKSYIQFSTCMLVWLRLEKNLIRDGGKNIKNNLIPISEKLEGDEKKYLE